MSSLITAGLESVGVLAPKFRASLTAEDGTTLEADATVREVHSGSSTPTDHPVEDGSTVTDHVIDQPDELEMNIIISNRPILFLASIRKQPSVEGGDPQTRAEDAYAAIVRIRKSAFLVIASTRLRTYEDMLIVSESATRDSGSGEILDITVRLRQFRKARVEAAESPEPVEENDKDKTDQGRKQTSDAAPAVQTKADSLLVSLADVVGGV